MTEGAIIVSVVVVGSVVFGAVWLLYQDVKKGVHARVERCEHAIDTFVSDCGKRKDDFITTKAFDRFENNLNTRFNGFDKNFEHLTERIDDLVMTVRNNGGVE